MGYQRLDKTTHNTHAKLKRGQKKSLRYAKKKKNHISIFPHSFKIFLPGRGWIVGDSPEQFSASQDFLLSGSFFLSSGEFLCSEGWNHLPLLYWMGFWVCCIEHVDRVKLPNWENLHSGFWTDVTWMKCVCGLALQLNCYLIEKSPFFVINSSLVFQCCLVIMPSECSS